MVTFPLIAAIGQTIFKLLLSMMAIFLILLVLVQRGRGGGLAGALLEAGLVDRFYWVQSPLWVGTDGVPATRALTGGPLAEAERWTVIERRSLGQDTLLVMDRKPCLPD